MAVLDDQAAKYAEMRTRIEHSFVHGEISLLKRLLVAWSGKLPQGIELGADGGLRVALAEPVECWFGLDQDCGRFVHLASRMPGSLTLVVHALGEVGAELLVRVPGPTAKHVHVLGANSPVRLMHPVAIDRCEVGLRIIGRGRIVRISLVFEPGEAASALGRGVDWFAPAAPAAAKAPKKPVTPPRPAAIVPAARAPEPARAAKAEPPKPAKSEPAKPVKAPDTPAPAPAASPVTTTAPPLPRAAAIPAMPAADPQLGEKVKKLAALSLGLKEFSPSLVKIPGLKQAATAAGDIKFGLEKHAYARMPDKFGIAERLQGLAGQIVTLKLDCVVRENANIEVFLGLKTPEQEFQASARPGYANSFRVPEKFESARIALRLAGSGSVEAMKISFEAQPELRVSSRLELRRHLIEVGVQPGKLKIALIADPFTQGNFIGIADIIPVRPNNWRALIAVEKPDLLFVESAWIGNDGAWANRFVNNIDELSDLVAFCRASGIPTVFWNKEDPIHFKRFIKSARLFDLVYTTCAECVPDYLAEGVARADVLPFAVNLATYNPIGGGRVREDWGVFAGSYYGAKYAERSADMDRMLDLTARHGLRIFDRHAGDTSDEFAFPERFRGHIIGSANARQLDAEYKQARIAINVNTVKDSKSM